jgi:predicted DsbA family dithiol-disulfide isomerase
LTEPVELEVFADASCRYSHYGLVTIRRVLDELAADPAVPAFRPSWRFLRLYDLEPPEGLPTAERSARSGKSAEEFAADQADLRARAAAEGVRIDETRYVFLDNPLLVHRLMAMCRDEPGGDVPELWALAFVIWSARYSRGVRTDELASLKQAVEDGGLEVPERLWERLADPNDHLTETLADRAYAQSIGLDGVPRLRINGTIVAAWHPFAEVMVDVRAALR